MKRFPVFIGLSLCMLIAACGKKSGYPATPSVQPVSNDSLVSMAATVNGSAWQTDSAFGYTVHTSTNDSGVVNLMITATRKSGGDTSTILLYISNFTGPNTYNIDPPINTAAYYNKTNRHFASSGQIVVVSDTPYAIIGTYNFVADSITVTAGSFNVATQ